MLNKVQLIGTLDRDPNVKRVGNNFMICELRVATVDSYIDRDGNDKSSTEWTTVVLKGKLAEQFEGCFYKGQAVYIEGKLQSRSFEHQGQKRVVTEVYAIAVKLIDPPPQLQQSNQNSQGDNWGASSGGDDEIPF